MSRTEVSEIIDVDGIELEIIAERIGRRQWQLAVRNPLGVLSVWNETFASSRAAVDAARKAIEEEGLEGFMDSDGFEYLLH
ncbi:MAG: hypothetical protein AB7Q97_24990 [Gammaproteobacteria bacterium]